MIISTFPSMSGNNNNDDDDSNKKPLRIIGHKKELLVSMTFNALPYHINEKNKSSP